MRPYLHDGCAGTIAHYLLRPAAYPLRPAANDTARRPHDKSRPILVGTWEPTPGRCVPVNPGGEPERDEGGLPPVDIEIPDDARELDREVLAFHREQRARRRRARWGRVLGPLRGHGAILPLIAGCVALSMVAGTLLSVISISPASAPVLSHSAGPAPKPASSPPAEGRSLPLDGTVVVSGKTASVRTLVRAVLALVPAHCRCDTALRQLAAQAAQARVRVYFVVPANADVTQLARTDGQGTAVAVKDAQNVLGSAYHPAGLTAVLVRADASTTVQRNLNAGFQLEDQLRSLGSGARVGSPPPGSATSAVPSPA